MVLTNLELLVGAFEELDLLCVFLLFYCSLLHGSLLDLFTLVLQLVDLTLKVTLVLLQFLNLKCFNIKQAKVSGGKFLGFCGMQL